MIVINKIHNNRSTLGIIGFDCIKKVWKVTAYHWSFSDLIKEKESSQKMILILQVVGLFPLLYKYHIM